MVRLIIFILILIYSSISQAQDIHRIACQGNLKKLDSLLATTDINIKNNTESTMLLVAVYCRQEKVFDFLLDKGADINSGNKFGETPLLIAIQSGNIKMVTSLLNKNANVNVRNDKGRSPLHLAVQSNNTEIFNLLLAKNAEINIIDNQKESPLHLAVLNGNLEIVKKLVNDKTEIDLINDRGSTPLTIAIRDNSDNIAKFLILKGADKNKVRTYQFKGELLGQPKPGLTSEIFAPNFISTENFVHSPTFSPNGKELYYTLESQKYHGGTIMVSKLNKGTWTYPKPANIEGDYKEIDPFIAPDGKTMYYSSDRPILKGGSVTKNIDLWMVKRNEKKWETPVHLGKDVNTPDADWFPTVSNKGTLFFSTGAGRSSNIVHSIFKDGNYQKAIPLEDAVNSKYRDYDPLIAPDESYLIFSSNRTGGFGSVDLYVSFKNTDGSWSKAKNMGEAINSSEIEFAPRISSDGKYFFFNRRGDIYWIDAKAIQNLK